MSELPPYSGPMSICRKCGNFDARTVYYDDGCTTLPDEYHERMCNRCGFIWYEAVLNADA